MFILLEFQVEFDGEGKVIGVSSEGETAKCKKVVCDPSYLPNKVIEINSCFDYLQVATSSGYSESENLFALKVAMLIIYYHFSLRRKFVLTAVRNK